jgi:hypothetical protein
MKVYLPYLHVLNAYFLNLETGSHSIAQAYWTALCSQAGFCTYDPPASAS